jgi:hypothetical protein
MNLQKEKEKGSRFAPCPVCKQQVVKYLLAHHLDSKCETIKPEQMSQAKIGTNTKSRT